MNELSWLIYLAGVVNYLGGWLTTFAIVTFTMCVIVTIWYVCSSKKVRDPLDQPPGPAWMLYPIFIFFLISSTMIPSRETVLAIAASEMGEKVLATPQAQRVGEALMNWIDQQTKPAPAPRDDRR